MDGKQYADYIESCNPTLFADYNKKITISPVVLKTFLTKAYDKGRANDIADATKTSEDPFTNLTDLFGELFK